MTQKIKFVPHTIRLNMATGNRAPLKMMTTRQPQQHQQPPWATRPAPRFPNAKPRGR
jgi:hypothetical protein